MELILSELVANAFNYEPGPNRLSRGVEDEPDCGESSGQFRNPARWKRLRTRIAGVVQRRLHRR
ncbi:hypothetical protein [Streptomyces sp. NPDC087297]|uniref:hypothetical protein n=1 Tax=Streptomyces sp. NPDC087297 TaxID=3365778 RepID=UPI0038114ED2